MKTKSLLFRHGRAVMAIGLAGVPWLACAAPISDLYSTGVDDAGQLLGAQVPDPHYRIVRIPDPDDPTAEGTETNAPASTLKAGFPVGPWVAEGPASRWIAPQADQSTGSPPGTYVYRTRFNLAGFDPATARIVGRWTSDNGGTDIVLNGASLGFTQGGDFGALSVSFEITSGFVDGTNLLDFVVYNAPPNVNPTGLRVQIDRATAEKPGDPPAFLTQPRDVLALVGDAVSLAVELDGSQPIAVRWQLGGQDVPGANAAAYSIPTISLAQAGDYTAIASNAYGVRTSQVARVRVLEPVPGIFATGVGPDGNALDDYAVDPHFRLIVNPDGGSEEPVVHDSTVFPIVAGPWVANTDRSKWIAPSGETSAAAAGDYVYRTSFTLPAGFDPATAVIFGGWASDNDGLDILVNGVGTGLRNTTQFASLTPFEIRQGIVSGANTLDFKINNASVGYTALRLDPLRIGALKGTGCRVRIATPPADVTAFAGAPVTLTVVADGCPPLSYQWRKDGQNLAGKTSASLDLGAVTPAQSGGYDVVVTDATGASLTSNAARVQVLEPIPGVFATGVDDAGKPLDDGAVDPHYRLVANPHDPASEEALVENSLGFPIVEGPWLANSETSKWIGPTFDTVAAPGEYGYRTTFVVPADFDPATVRVEGSWTSDNNAPDILVNGKGTGISITGDFAVLTRFVITNGFVGGTNTLEFRVANAGTEANPTGLRVEGLRADGAKGAATPPTLTIDRTPTNVRLSWPVSATGYRLFTASAVAGGAWTEASAPVSVEGDRNVATVTPSASSAFFRLQR